MQRNYRGQRVDTKEWVYGYYYCFGNKHYINVIEQFPGGASLSCVEVIPETVGQSTGLNDKNGKEIYEGDLIPYHFNHKRVGTVTYGEYRGPFDNEHAGHAGFYLEWNKPDSSLRIDLGYWIKVSEVIGNIYDNPELLQEVER